MQLTEFNRRLKHSPRPLIVDFWAPWCGPCRAMEPAFKQATQQYAGRVDVLKINADESPDVLRALGVMGIPTVIAFDGEKQILRRTGMQTPDMLQALFEAALNKEKPAIVPPAPIDRLLRTGAGLALLALAAWNQFSWVLLLAGAALVFSAFYDRCPIYRNLAPRLRALFQRKS